MTKGSRRRSEAAQIVEKSFTEEEIDRGIERLTRRIGEVEALDPQQIRYDDAQVEVVERAIRDTVREVFGAQSPEAGDFAYPRIYASSNRMVMFGENPHHQTKFARGITQIVVALRGLIAKLDEKRLYLTQS